MKRVCIGIHVYAEPGGLRATLASVRANTSGEVELLLLPDGPDEETAAALAALPELRQSGTDSARGAAVCFNRLASRSDADVLVLLESGAQVAPLWLDFLLAALSAAGRNGLAGPSTNRSWNEQGAFPSAAGTPARIAQTAREAARRFRGDVRTLAPLYSLADFCYAVRREVYEELGAADEEYATGPCWEMDYNVRAARAGWHGVWACNAYVHRAPANARRVADERRLFEVNKRRYQDKFCGARLRGDKTDYRAHCRGDACPNFAPPELIQLRLRAGRRGARGGRDSAPHTLTEQDARLRPLEKNEGGQPPTPPHAHGHQATLNHQATAGHQTPPHALDHQATPHGHAPEPAPHGFAPETARVSSGVLVTCIMPTCDRPAFVPQAIRSFLRQGLAEAELLVVDDGVYPVAHLVPEDPRVRYLRLGEKLSVGAKRNLACEHAFGEFIAHWDDDDWYPSWRLRAQLDALRARDADLCGTSQLVFFEAATRRAWRYAYGGGRAPWVAGSTLVYRKSFWRRHHFPDVQVGEDTRFVWANSSARVCDLAEPTLCVASVHEANTSRKATEGCYWHPLPYAEVQNLLGDELHFYSTAAPSAREWPLVSCIMPTYNRRPFAPLALRRFQEQDYPHKELVVVDDGSDPVADIFLGQPNVRYLRLSMRTSIGGKRNAACREARGQIIAHWDDDDWYSPDRLRYQAAPILSGDADLTGLVTAFALELPSGEFWTALPHLHLRMFVGDVAGGTLVYRASILGKGVRYPETSLAEDAALIRQAVGRGQRLQRLANPEVYIYVRHGRNTWREYQPGSFLDPDGWRRVARPATFSPTSLSAYLSAAASA